MTTEIKPIETTYNGYRFRSRTEARWAVFFDALGLEYEYEPETYDLGKRGWYLPDFKLLGTPDNYPLWIEIKGRDANENEMEKMYSLIELTGGAGAILVGQPGNELIYFIEYIDISDGTGEAVLISMDEDEDLPNKSYLSKCCFWRMIASLAGSDIYPMDTDAYEKARAARFEFKEKEKMAKIQVTS